jgi:hypothetical protein
MKKPRGLKDLTSWTAHELYRFMRALHEDPELTFEERDASGTIYRKLKPEVVNDPRYQLLRRARLKPWRRGRRPIALNSPRMMQLLWKAFFDTSAPAADRARQYQRQGGGSNKLFSSRGLEHESKRKTSEDRVLTVKLRYAEYQEKNTHLKQPHLRASFCRKLALEYKVSERTIKRYLQLKIPC